jgi:RNA polymerase sigma-70 factor (ECF subfamily)
VDAATLEAFRRRDPEAVRVLYREYGRLVYAVAHRVLGRSDLAEDATQQTFVRAWQAAERLDSERDPGAWLATIAKRTAIDIARHEGRRPASALDDVNATDPAVVTAAPELATLDAIWRVRQAIEELPEDEAAVVRLQHLEGMTHSQIAERMQIAVGTVKSRSHRAHGKLAHLLSQFREPVA